MSKCPICNSCKGKRQCRLHNALVCPLCCGTSRIPTACDGCTYYKPPERRYGELPRYSAQEMASTALQKMSFPIEAGVCQLDRERQFTMRDAQAIAIFELLLDIYSFGDTREALAPRIVALDCAGVIDRAERELQSYDRAQVAKIIATVRFTACRRAEGGRHHLDLLQEYCGR